MYQFTYYAPTEVIFGADSILKTESLIKKYGGKKVLLLYGGGSVRSSGLLNHLEEILEAESIPYVELGGVVPNPRLSLVYRGIDLCREEHVDFILAIGGGSVIDSAKAIGYGLANDGDVWDFYEHTRQAKAGFPVGVILTIAAAGSEMSWGSVITKEEGQVKRAYDDDLARPKFAILDPGLTQSLSAYQTSCGCTDILMHTMERYFTVESTMEITDNIAEALMRTVIKNALVLQRDPGNYAARAELMWAGSLSHNGLTGCGNGGSDFSTHMLEHEISGMFDVAHGAGLSALWGSWARYVYLSCLPRFERFAVQVMGVGAGYSPEKTALKGIEAVEMFFRAIHMPTSLSELGVFPTEEQLAQLAHMCSIAAGGTMGTAKKLKEGDMLAIYQMAVQ